MSHLRIYLGRLMNEQYTPPPKPKFRYFFLEHKTFERFYDN